MQFTLHRTLPGGQEKTQGPFETTAEAAKAASRCLHDNGAASKVGAQRFGLRLARLPHGTTEAHESGYAFRIESH